MLVAHVRRPSFLFASSVDADQRRRVFAILPAWRLAHYYAVTRDGRILPLLQRMHATLVRAQFPAVPAGLRIRDGKPLVDYSGGSSLLD